jgi:hypothetical protein
MSIFDKYDLVEVDESFPIPEIPKEGLILIVGSSGSGKSTILKHHFGDGGISFNEEIELYKNFTTEENAEKFLIASGLRTIPSWKRPYFQLSNGEQHRAYIALCLDKNFPIIDEFTSLVDRNTAKSLSLSIEKFFRRSKMKRIVLATCHRDIIEWLNPNHVYDTDFRQYMPRGCLQRPQIKINVIPCDPEKIWQHFKRHHYLSGKINKSCNSWVAMYNETLVGFTSIIAFPNGNWKSAWRGHRTVIIPEFQGMGIGNRLSECVAQIVVDSGSRFFSKTSHPAMGEHRNNSKLWKPTSKNKVLRKDYNSNRKTKEDGHKRKHVNRICYSHEYVGENPNCQEHY